MTTITGALTGPEAGVRGVSVALGDPNPSLIMTTVGGIQPPHRERGGKGWTMGAWTQSGEGREEGRY